MMRKIVAIWVSLAMLFGFMVIVDVVIDFTPTVKATIFYVNETGSGGAYTSIQDAINAANDGDTVFVYNGTYNENIVVNRTINLTGEDRDNTIINGRGSWSVIKIETNWVNVSGFSVINGSNGILLASSSNNYILNNNISNTKYYGIYLYYSTNNSITNNNVSNNDAGIYLISYSKNNTIAYNTIFSNTYYAISLTGSSHNTITNNTISSSNQIGIYLSGATNTTIVNNKMMGNGIGIPHGGLAAWNSHTIDTTNTVNGKPVYYWKDRTGGTVPFGAGQVILANCTNVIVKNQNMSDGSVGIELGHSNNNTIANNTASWNNWFGIFLYSSSNNNINNNTASSNTDYGIFILANSDNNKMVNNTISNNVVGICLIDSSSNKITNNDMIDNGISIKGDNIDHWNTHTIDTTNTVNEKPLYYWRNQTGGIVPIGAGQVILANCTNVIVEKQNVSDGSVGIELGFSNNNTIINNTASSNKWDGINLYSSKRNTIINNNVSNNIHGIYIFLSSYNNITSNNVSNNDYGIFLPYANINIIAYNTVSWNELYGIYIEDSNSYGNIVYHNNIVNNTIQADDNSDFSEDWDLGYPLGGNYWSDYIGLDNFKGPKQDIPGSDGIGDTRYIIDFNTFDHYPLIKPFKSLENYTILKQGWNLISIPLIQENQSLVKVLEMIDGYYDAVQWYDPNNRWGHHKVAKPFGNDLFELNETMGFWIHIINPGDTIFLYNGTQPTSNQINPLHPGWNMVGYPSQTSYNRTEGLNNLTFGDKVDAIWSYDAATQKWEEMGESDSFEIGKGYYIHAKSESEWEVPL